MWLLKKKYFNKSEEKRIVSAIKEAELASSGEVRVFIENHCKSGKVEARTIEVFKNLEMEKTRERNAVLIYLAVKDHRFAIFGDEGIYQKTGVQFWDNEASTLRGFFKENKMVEGLSQVIIDIGNALKTHFPYPLDDTNELPDGIVYG